MGFLKSDRTRSDLVTYALVIVMFAIIIALQQAHVVSRALSGQLVPITCYIVMAISLNLLVGVSGELSLGHAGFMSIGAFSGIICAMSLADAVPFAPVRLMLGIAVGALAAAVAGVIVGLPVMRLRGDYLAIVTLAFGEIIKELVNCLIVGVDAHGLHVLFNLSGEQGIESLHLGAGGRAIIKGAQGASGTIKIATFIAGFVLVMVSLVILQNLVRSRSGRAIRAVRDNRIAAESVGISITKYRLVAFVVSAALAGAAGALFGNNFSQLSSSKFDFNTSILILVFVVLGGLGSMRGSLMAATVLTLLPEALRGFSDYRMLAYATVLIVVMIITNSSRVRALAMRARDRLRPRRTAAHV